MDPDLGLEGSDLADYLCNIAVYNAIDATAGLLYSNSSASSFSSSVIVISDIVCMFIFVAVIFTVMFCCVFISCRCCFVVFLLAMDVDPSG